eukprot:15453607-Alexandrium_andersonii.AAC.1
MPPRSRVGSGPRNRIRSSCCHRCGSRPRGPRGRLAAPAAAGRGPGPGATKTPPLGGSRWHSLAAA